MFQIKRLINHGRETWFSNYWTKHKSLQDKTGNNQKGLLDIITFVWHKALLYDGPCVVSVEEYKFLWNAEQDQRRGQEEGGIKQGSIQNRMLHRCLAFQQYYSSSRMLYVHVALWNRQQYGLIEVSRFRKLHQRLISTNTENK